MALFDKLGFRLVWSFLIIAPLISSNLFAQQHTATGDTYTAETAVNRLFRSSYELFAFARNDKGIYLDKVKFEGGQDTISSIAAIGAGLVSLCIADQMGWIDDAEAQAKVTLESLLGITPGVVPDINDEGFYQHWLDPDNLTRADGWVEDYSTIDTAILAAGAMFTKTHFQSPNISVLVDQLWQSIDWKEAIADPMAGYLYRQLNSSGKQGITKPYSEYMLVAWLAFIAERGMPDVSAQLWANSYEVPADLPTLMYDGHSVLTDDPPNFQSHFTVQFAYFMSHYFASDPEYVTFFRNAALADRAWWEDANPDAADHEWGLCAGEVPGGGYSADAINNNPDLIVSPHCIGGFLAEFPEFADDLTAMFAMQDQTLYVLPNTAGDTLLWRYSRKNTDSVAAYIQLIDYSTMLYGLASLPEHLGTDFFLDRNDFDLNAWPTVVDSIADITSLYVGGDSVVIDLSVVFSDMDLDDLVYEIQSVDNTIASATLSGDSLTVEAVSMGVTSVDVIATDSSGGYALDSFNVFVTVGNSNEEVPDEGRDGFSLTQSFPNPFSGVASIQFEVPISGEVTIKVFDVQGREVALLAQRVYPIGKHEVSWDASGLSDGMYFYQLESNAKRITRKMILLR